MLNEYHKAVYEKISPLLTEEEGEALAEGRDKGNIKIFFKSLN